MRLSELFLQQYFRELEYKDNVLNKLQFILAIYISGFSAMAYMVKMATPGKTFLFCCYSTNYINIFYFFIILAFVCYSISFVYFVKNMMKYKVRYLPYFSDILKYRNKLSSYHQNKKSDNIIDHERKFNDYFLEQLAICNDDNHKINRLRVQILRLSFIFAIVASLTLLLSGVIFLLTDLDASSPSKVGSSFDSNSPMVKSLDNLSNNLNREGMSNE